MNETKINEGWAFLLDARYEHYFIGGRSLCRKWIGLGLNFEQTLGQPKCKACQKALEKREKGKNKQ